MVLPKELNLTTVIHEVYSTNLGKVFFHAPVLKPLDFRNSGNRGYSTLALIILLIFVLFLEFQISLTCFLSCALAAGACSKIKEKKSPIYSICDVGVLGRRANGTH
ncbi:unnamed protein product [Cuscuta epithymum]|uniref:Uncharacterized protein n=1 Tax=Cuscuta epithymum TaxID=186058 RepID=A0AAV0EUI7_9ASTE|nr:unnamed protein product [Cuscuta epithymum]